jgi:hypothetical protein
LVIDRPARSDNFPWSLGMTFFRYRVFRGPIKIRHDRDQ